MLVPLAQHYVADEVCTRLRQNFLLFYTGEARDASAVLADQDSRTKTRDDEMLENMHRTKQMGLQSRDLLVAGDLFAYAELMHEHWLNKRKRSPGMATSRIDAVTPAPDGSRIRRARQRAAKPR